MLRPTTMQAERYELAARTLLQDSTGLTQTRRVFFLRGGYSALAAMARAEGLNPDDVIIAELPRSIVSMTGHPDFD